MPDGYLRDFLVIAVRLACDAAKGFTTGAQILAGAPQTPPVPCVPSRLGASIAPAMTSPAMYGIGPRELILAAIAALVCLGWILAAIGAGSYAVRLNRSGAWGFLALVVSPLPVFLLLFGLGPRSDDDDDDYAASCPFCAEDVKPEARLCPHCRSDLARTGAERLRPR